MWSVVMAALGAVGIFLLGMVSLERGLEGLAGGRLERVLARFTKSPTSGALTGAAVTAVLQSSSATTLTAVALTGAGLLTFAQALGIVLGANVGTTVTGWLVALVGFEFKVGAISGLMVFTGVLTHLFAKNRLRYAGLALAGFGLVFLGIGALRDALGGLEGIVTPDSFPSDDFGGRVLLVLIGIAVTLVTQSSSAGVAAALAALHTGAIDLPQAAALVIGMDVGTTGTALFATIGGTTSARRTGLAHVLFNILSGVGAFFFLDLYAFGLERALPGTATAHPELALVGFHTAFNLLAVLGALPFARRFARLVERIVPEREDPLTRALEPRLAKRPKLAVDAAARSLHAIARRVLRATLREVDLRERRGPGGTDLVRLDSAIERVADFVGAIPTSDGDTAALLRETALVHQTDHLARLVDRLGAIPRGVSTAFDPEFEAQREDLVRALVRTLRDDGPTARGFDAQELRGVRDRLEASDENLRTAWITRAAADHLGATEALARLESLRWLRRVAHHTWRIAAHSGVALGSTRAASSDGATHRERGADTMEPV
ncbi:Na+/Pi-cotransporter [Planctomycetes bacterium Pla163]|uniref:Na+/Pi-cotransporter n=1 Tax=Rohdeia mirabilis TaxID=2528008 RepID=A0A518D191_9BACT|nr:Na+/Pi-cotransporter [Planctomycetes bacterium Pla163]